MAHLPPETLQLCIAVTGHRDLVPAEIARLESRVESFFRQLTEGFPDLPLVLLTPLATGGDQLAARVALRLGLPFEAVLPMDLEEYEKDFTEPGSLEDFRSLLDRAEAVTCLPAAPGNSGPPYQASARDVQYAQLGVFLSNHCQILLALWDGMGDGQQGGTGQVVGYHLTAVMPGFEADAFPASLLAENENDLVHHVVCSRDRPDGSPRPGLRPLEAAWLTSREGGTRTPGMPEEYRVLLERLQQFARDGRDKASRIAANSASLLSHSPELALPAGAMVTDQLFQAADGLALHYQRRVHNGLRAIHLLAVLMGVEFILYAEFDGPAYMVLIFLLLFLTGVVVHLVGERREWHRKYLDYRALAEGLRVQLYWNLAGVVDARSVEFAYDNFLQQQDVDMGWIRHVMRQASRGRKRGEPPDTGWVPWVIDHWVGSSAAGHGQLAYYARKRQQNSRRYRRTSLLGTLTLWAGIAFALALLLLSGEGSSALRQLLLILMGALPLIAGVWDAYSHKRAEKELIKQYAFMGRVFGRARQLLDGTEDIELQRRVLRALGQAALDEGAEWLLMHRERPLEHGRL